MCVFEWVGGGVGECGGWVRWEEEGGWSGKGREDVVEWGGKSRVVRWMWWSGAGGDGVSDK